jgi:peptidoglycan-associated lipoprotein
MNISVNTSPAVFAAIVAVALASGCAKTKPPVVVTTSVVLPTATLAPSAPGKANSTIYLSDRLRKECGITTIESVTDAPKFDFDRSAILAEDADVLALIAQCLTTGPLKGRSVRLVGRADPRGAQEYNMALGERRSNAALSYLAGLGVAAGQLHETSRGALDAAGNAEATWRVDRRVDVDVLSP